MNVSTFVLVNATVQSLHQRLHFSYDENTRCAHGAHDVYV